MKSFSQRRMWKGVPLLQAERWNKSPDLQLRGNSVWQPYLTKCVPRYRPVANSILIFWNSKLFKNKHSEVKVHWGTISILTTLNIGHQSSDLFQSKESVAGHRPATTGIRSPVRRIWHLTSVIRPPSPVSHLRSSVFPKPSPPFYPYSSLQTGQ